MSTGPEYQPREPASRAPDPQAPVDYPTYPALPPPVYPAPYAGYGTGYPYDPYRPMKPLGTNGWAIAALIISLVSLLFCGVTSIVGLIIGIIAMRDTKRTGQDGYGIALAAVLISGIQLALWVLYGLLLVVILASGWQWAP
jgi:hypothetical protein